MLSHYRRAEGKGTPGQTTGAGAASLFRKPNRLPSAPYRRLELARTWVREDFAHIRTLRIVLASRCECVGVSFARLDALWFLGS